jgi:hypothetical protein
MLSVIMLIVVYTVNSYAYCRLYFLLLCLLSFILFIVMLTVVYTFYSYTDCRQCCHIFIVMLCFYYAVTCLLLCLS